MLALLAAALTYQTAPPIQFTEVLGIAHVGKGGRVPFPTDAVQAQIVDHSWRPPVEHQELVLPDGTKAVWKKFQADKDGWFKGDPFDSGYGYAVYDSPVETNALLQAQGDSMVYVNETPRGGDPYMYGYLKLPVRLHIGRNEFLFACGRGQLRANLTLLSERDPLINPDDMTLPDELVGPNPERLGAVVVINTSEFGLKNQALVCGLGSARLVTHIPTVPPMSIRKVPFRIPAYTGGKPGDVPLTLSLASTRGTVASHIRVRGQQQTRKITFRSKIDDSIQYFAVNPPRVEKPNLAMLFSLHGASVEAIGQADAYSPKDWAWVVCPTNRRPFGFDWEGVGRDDALEVLAIAQKMFRTDPSRTYLTGHSMGGHGTWQLGALYPDKWAAIAPSAGWSSFYSYVGVPWDKKAVGVADILQRSYATSDTTEMLQNLASEGVYILHGDADDNVPVAEARTMHSLLEPLNPDLGYHEQPGAGHWWSTPRTKGASCLEWPEMMEFLKAHQLKTPAQIDFTTVDLAISNSCHGVTVLGQTRPHKSSRVVSRHERDTLLVTTENIRALSISPAWAAGDRALNVDGDNLKAASGSFELSNGHWRPSNRRSIEQVGPFKRIFDNRFMLVYGTGGTHEENAWAFDKARFDAEQFYYRGNGSADVESDKEYLVRPQDRRNVLLYGNTDTNGAWTSLIPKSRFLITHEWIRLAGSPYLRRRHEPDACLFIAAGSHGNLIGAVSGTSVEAMRLTDRLPYFSSGVGYPDWILFGPNVLRSGNEGVYGAGFYDPSGAIFTDEASSGR